MFKISTIFQTIVGTGDPYGTKDWRAAVPAPGASSPAVPSTFLPRLLAWAGRLYPNALWVRCGIWHAKIIMQCKVAASTSGMREIASKNIFEVFLKMLVHYPDGNSQHSARCRKDKMSLQIYIMQLHSQVSLSLTFHAFMMA